VKVKKKWFSSHRLLLYIGKLAEWLLHSKFVSGYYIASLSLAIAITNLKQAAKICYGHLMHIEISMLFPSF